MLRFTDAFMDKLTPTPNPKEYYLIGSLRNDKIATIGATLRSSGIGVFDSWFAAGPIADDCWQAYEKAKGLSYPQALGDYAAQHVFAFDKYHLDRTDGAILALPAGKSGHMELGYVLGRGKPGYILMDGEPDRWDVMYNFANGVFFNIEDLIGAIKNGR